MYFDIGLRGGIGDILYAWAAVENIKHKYEKIYVDIDFNIITAFKNNSNSYKQFLIDITKIMFCDSKYVLFENKSTNDTYRLFDIGALTWVPIPTCNLLLDRPSPHKIDGEYIVVTTKNKYITKQNYLSFKNIFLNKIKNLSTKYKIVILGERDVDNNQENIIHAVETIYSDLIYCCDNYIDLTEPVLCSTNDSKQQNLADLNKVKEDCDLMNKAKCVITLGFGGNMTLAVAVSNKVVGYVPYTDRVSQVPYANGYTSYSENITVTDNLERFFLSLDKI
jgi:hypothetical protein